MAGILTQPHFQRIEARRRVEWVLQGRPGSISLLKRVSAQGFVEFLSVDKGVFFFTEDADGKALPSDVMFEAQISELMITDEDVEQLAAIDHGRQRFRLIKGSGGEPGTWPPEASRCFWRVWIAPLEDVP